MQASTELELGQDCLQGFNAHTGDVISFINPVMKRVYIEKWVMERK